jgi:ABC-type multidrug transport system fused ATPase/permease subunit
MASDISQIQEVLNTTVAEFLRQAMIIIGGVAMLFVVSPKLTLTMLAIVPIMAIAAVFFGRFIRKLSKEAQDHIAQSTNIVEEAVTGIQNVKAFTNELYESVRFGKSVDEIRRVSLKSGIYRGAFASFIIICIFGAIMGILWYAMYMVQQGLITQGMMVQFMVLALTIGISIGGMAELYASLQKGIGATERVFEIIDEMAEPVTIQDNSSRIKLQGSIEFRHIDFTYPSRPELPVLRDVSFTANPGEQVAIVGPSGAGKSTITSILLQFYKQSGGELLIDGKPAAQYELTELRKHMAIVPQEVTLFGGTIKENIAYGMPNATLEEIQEAADLANASEFIHRFPEGFETKVGERGVQLSGGQRQRVAIARAVLNNPTILILDEATSSLDSESERLVQDALENLMKGRTSVVIAHRLSTIKKADKILVLEHGHLREQGTHEELVAIEDGLYKHLSKLQFQV